jgi:hypothetical protein
VVPDSFGGYAQARVDTLGVNMFRSPRRSRLLTALFVVLSLLFSQLALANYVCPGAPAELGDMSAMEMAPGEPCDGMGAARDEGQPVLCHQHCVNAAQSFDPVKVPAVSLPAVVQVLVVPLLLDASGSEEGAYIHKADARPPPDPVFLSTLRLRV